MDPVSAWIASWKIPIGRWGKQFFDFHLTHPSVAEQRRIVAELDALQGQVSMLKRLQTESAAEMDALLPSVLDKAFKGEL